VRNQDTEKVLVLSVGLFYEWS